MTTVTRRQNCHLNVSTNNSWCPCRNRGFYSLLDRRVENWDYHTNAFFLLQEDLLTSAYGADKKSFKVTQNLYAYLSFMHMHANDGPILEAKKKKKNHTLDAIITSLLSQEVCSILFLQAVQCSIGAIFARIACMTTPQPASGWQVRTSCTTPLHTPHALFTHSCRGPARSIRSTTASMHIFHTFGTQSRMHVDKCSPFHARLHARFFLLRVDELAFKLKISMAEFVK